MSEHGASDPLTYPLAETPQGGSGEAVEVAPGVLWFRMPLGGGPGAINVWAIADGDSWVVVDTGWRSPETVRAWRHAFDHALARRPIGRILVTHMHPDHSGMAGWLAAGSGARLWMTRLEYLMLRVLAMDAGREAPPEGVAFYRSTGWDEEAVDRYRARFGEFSKLIYPLPDSFRRISDGDVLSIGGREWQVVIGSGHSPEHACFHCPSLGLLISGDQVLPRISSNVSVYPLEPEADPLSDWLHSLAAIRDRIPDEVLVLPAHGRPFRGLHARIDSLIAGHEEGLAQLMEALSEPRRVIDLFPSLFRRQITLPLIIMATGETLAHLSCLRSRGLACREIDGDGIAWWRRAVPAG